MVVPVVAHCTVQFSDRMERSLWVDDYLIFHVYTHTVYVAVRARHSLCSQVLKELTC